MDATASRMGGTVSLAGDAAYLNPLMTTSANFGICDTTHVYNRNGREKNVSFREFYTC
jgi:hypothetical protein